MIDIVIVRDSEIRRMKKRWFGIDKSTDVIAFDLGRGADPRGEIYISIDTARRQAKARGVPLGLELKRLAVHGTAHIEGYDDCDRTSFIAMREREWELLISCL